MANKEVKHVVWTDTITGDSGRVAIVREWGALTLTSLGDTTAPLEVLFRAFEMNAAWVERANECEFARQNLFCTRVVQVDDEGVEVRLHTLRGVELKDAPVAARLCLINGRVQNFSRMWFGDLPALLVAAMEAGLRQPHVFVEQAEIFESDEWRMPRSLLLYTRDDESLFYSDASRPWELSDEHGLPLPPMFWEDGHGELTPLLEDLQKFHSSEDPSSSWWELLEKLQGVKDPGLFTDSDFE